MPSDLIFGEIVCGQCRYSLNGLHAKSCCPECGHRVRRSLAAMRWRAWQRRRPASLALQEAMIGFAVGFLVLTFICGGFMTPRPPRYFGAYVVSGVAVGLCFTMLQSSIRRVPRWRPHERAAILACGIPSILASTFWVLMVISLIVQHW